MSGVTLEHVDRIFRERKKQIFAVHDLSLEVGEGELLSLVGPSGCGKTTTLRVIAGLDEPSSGTIRIAERVVNRIHPRDRDVAMVFQNYALYPHMTVYQNIAFPLKMRKLRRPEIHRKVTETAEQMGLSALLDRKPAALSGGEKQRTAVARAIVRNPRVFLLDEPLSNLDVPLRVQLRGEIKRLQRSLGTTTIYVTHDQEEAMSIGDRIAVMREGVLQQSGTPLEVYHRPGNRFVAGFIGTPAMNLIPGTVVGVNGELEFHFGTRRIPISARTTGGPPPVGPAVMGIRAQDVRAWSETVSLTEGHVGLGEGVVQLVEATGEYTNVRFMLDGRELVARTNSDAVLREGDCVRLTLDNTRLHFFETGENGKRIA